MQPPALPRRPRHGLPGGPGGPGAADTTIDTRRLNPTTLLLYYSFKVGRNALQSA